MTAQCIEVVLRTQERSWAWLARQIGTNAYRMWRLRRGEVPWRRHEALKAADVLGVPYATLFGDGAMVLPAGRERAAGMKGAVA